MKDYLETDGKVIKNIEKDKEQILFNEGDINFGFKIFKLDKSNFKIWDSEKPSPDKKSLEKLNYRRGERHK